MAYYINRLRRDSDSLLSLETSGGIE